jgi:hypothetical protein
MTAIHFLLNLAGLLLWMKWAGLGAPNSRAAPVGVQFPGRQNIHPRSILRVIWLGTLVLFLIGRAVIYWQVGYAAKWVPTVSLGAIHLTFRSDIFSRMLLFSLIGFLQTLGQYYLFLLLASASIPRGLSESPILRLIRQQLSWIDRWPAWVKLFLPVPIMTIVWLGFTPVLARVNLLLPPQSQSIIALQGVVLGISACLFWAYAAAAILFLYLLNSYIYFPAQTFWAFVQEFGERLVHPLSSLPLRLRKADFAPVLGIALMLGVARFAPLLLTAAFRRLH